MIDIHAHPFLIPEIAASGSSGVADFLAMAAKEGVGAVIAAATDIASSRLLYAWGKELPSLYAAIGVHPWYLDNVPPDYIGELRALAKNGSKVVAIGEIGLDGNIERPIEEQLPIFLAQLDLAYELGLPAIIHARKAGQKVLDILLSRPPQPLVLHSFSGSLEQLEPLLKRGSVYVSFSGSVTRPGARRIRTLAAKLPLENILLETDSPSIGIEGFTPGTVEPKHLKYVARAIANIRQITLAEVDEITEQNTHKLFGKIS